MTKINVITFNYTFSRTYFTCALELFKKYCLNCIKIK